MIPVCINRRSLLHTVSGLGLSFLMPAMDLLAAQKRRRERPRSLITLWLQGGPSQLETWDPHPGSPIGGQVRAIPTTVPGLKISDFLPRMAEQMDSLSVIRSLTSKEGDHQRGTYFVKTGWRPDPTLTHPALSAIITEAMPDPSVEIPMHVSLCANEMAARGGFLGARYDAFKVFDPGRNLQNLRAGVDTERQQRRLTNLEVLGRSFAKGRETRVKDTLHREMIDRAITMMSSEQLNAFRIDEESAQTVAGYGDTRFGRGCLVARRLVETGVRAIEVVLDGFDTHVNNHEGQKTQASILDPAFASLVSDLKERDLLESTIVLCIGEFGRTPRINPAGGRDHWPNGFSCVLGGGGLTSGLVLGETSPTDTVRQPKDPVRIPDLYATILSAMNLAPNHEYLTPIGRPMARTDAGTPIPQLMSEVPA